jgi:hypothetical protein
MNLLIDENFKVHQRIPNLADAKNLPIPEKNFNETMRSHYWHNGALYSLAKERNKGEGTTQFERWFFAKWQDGKWHHLGDYNISSNQGKSRSMPQLLAIPCDNDRFIVISSNRDLYLDARPERTPFHRMYISEGGTELKLEAPIDHGQDELREHMVLPNCFELAWMSEIVITDRHATLINTRTGLYWIFSKEDASLVKAGNIFKKVTPKMVAKLVFPNEIVLCVNPERDGTVLVAAQEEDFFMNETRNVLREISASINKTMGEDSLWMSDEEIYDQIFWPKYKEFVERSPFIAWYRIYPETGEVEHLKEAPKGASFLRDDGNNDQWWPMLDGSLKFAKERKRVPLEGLEKFLK